MRPSHPCAMGTVPRVEGRRGVGSGCATERLGAGHRRRIRELGGSRRGSDADLPTEAQWEWAARASRGKLRSGRTTRAGRRGRRDGTSGPPRHWTGSFAGSVADTRPFTGVSSIGPATRANCRDAYAPDYRRALGIPRRPVCESEDALVPRVVRGGSWFEDHRDLRVFARSSTARPMRAASASGASGGRVASEGRSRGRGRRRATGTSVRDELGSYAPIRERGGGRGADSPEASCTADRS
jgi:hypothetical protein